MDYWAIGSPQADPCRCDGDTGGTEFSEAVGSFYMPMNLQIRDPSAHAQFAMADGSVHFLSESIDMAVYRNLGARNDGNPVNLD